MERDRLLQPVLLSQQFEQITGEVNQIGEDLGEGCLRLLGLGEPVVAEFLLRRLYSTAKLPQDTQVPCAATGSASDTSRPHPHPQCTPLTIPTGLLPPFLALF